MLFLIFTFGLSLLVTYWILWEFWTPSSWPQPSFQLPILQTHRGYWIEGAPQNSLPAFIQAAQRGSQMIEFDVRICADKIPILYHDKDIDLQNGQKERIAEVTLAKLKNIVAINTLEEVFQSREIPRYLNIELKSESWHNQILVNEVCKLVDKYQMESRIIISSFNPICLFQFKRKKPNIPIALLNSKEPGPGYNWFLRQMVSAPLLRPNLLHLDHRDVNQRQIRRYMERGVPIVVWTLNNRERAQELLNWGVRSIISDEILDLYNSGIDNFGFTRID